MNRACFYQNPNLHEQNKHASCIRPLKINCVRMKKFLLISLLIISATLLNAQTKVDKLTALEQSQQSTQDQFPTATLKSASRLFADKNDLTSVILIIPADSVVTVIDSDSTYLHVSFEDNEGFIYKRQARMNKMPATIKETVEPQSNARVNQTEQDQTQSRFSYLENKYGSNMAARLMSGKIWKGMTTEVVNDSWGTAEKINRVINGNIIKEEWIYRNTWLYFENDRLIEWGPIKK